MSERAKWLPQPSVSSTAPRATFALTKAVRDRVETSGTTCKRTLPDALPRTSTAPTTIAFSPSLTPTSQARLWAADVSLVDLDSLPERLAIGTHHRPTQLLQHRPGRLISANP